MKNLRKRLSLGAAMLGSTAALLLAAPVQAQDYPSRPLRLIVPFAPGGAADIIGRAVSEPMSRELGQPILIVNRDGAGTVIGVNEAANAATDGYTLLLSGDAGVINAASGRKLSYDLLRDLAPISIVYSGAQVLMANRTGKFANLQDLVKYGKANPGKVRYGSTGVGTSVHLSSEIFNQAAGIETVHVPYKGVAPAMNDLAGGHIEYVIGGSTAAIPAIKSGLVRGLALMSKTRSSQIPDLPTAIEQGVNAETGSWYGIYMRAGTPTAAQVRIHGVLMKVLASSEVTERFRSLGGEPRSMSQQEFTAYTRNEVQKLAKLMKQLNIKLEN